jgi:tRNA pseudouridine38-40 synthase
LREGGGGGHALDLRKILARVRVPGIEQTVDQRAFVAEQEQAFAVGVESADRIHARRQAEECAPTRPGLWRELREYAVRLVEREEHARKEVRAPRQLKAAEKVVRRTALRVSSTQRMTAADAAISPSETRPIGAVASAERDTSAPALAPGVRRWKCVCAYDGTAFAGWQSQPGGVAIQDVIEARIAQIFGGLIRINASGRTDAGVHARGQVFHFDAAWKHGPERLRAALRVGLPPTIQIVAVRAVAATFHARFSATGKRYIYQIHLGEADPFTRPYAWVIERPLDVAAMMRAAELLQGRHDFRAFSALNGPPKEDTVRDLRRFAVRQRGRRVNITAEADGFMYKMVRSLVGALVAVGDGNLTLAQVGALLDSRERTPLVQTAPPQGLFLGKVFY